MQKLELIKVLLFISTEPTFILSTAGTTVPGLNDTTVNKIGFTLGKRSNKQEIPKFINCMKEKASAVGKNIMEGVARGCPTSPLLIIDRFSEEMTLKPQLEV